MPNRCTTPEPRMEEVKDFSRYSPRDFPSSAAFFPDGTLWQACRFCPVWGLKRLRGLPMRLTTTTRQAGSVAIVDISGRIVLGQETFCCCRLHRQLRRGLSCRCFHKRAESQGRTEAALPYKKRAGRNGE